MISKHPIQTPQDTAKKTLPFLTPAGRVEDFYDFSTPDAPGDNTQKAPGDTSKKSAKVPIKKQSDQSAQKKAAKPEPKKTVEPEVAKLQPLDNDTALTLAPELPDVSGYKFLSDTIRPGFDFNYLKGETAEEVPESLPLFDYAPSVFMGHELEAKGLQPVKLPVRNEDSLAIAFVAILTIFSLVKVVYYKKASQYLASFFNLRMNIQILRDEKSINELLYSIMLLGSMLITSTFLFQLFDFLGIKFAVFDGIVQGFTFLKIFVTVLLAIIAKFSIVRIVGYLLGSGRSASDYIFNQIMFFNILNIALFFICVTIQYSDLVPLKTMFIISGALIAIVFGFMLQRSMVLGNSEAGIPTYYLFLYLCTLEIFPLIILAKLLINAIG